MEGDGRIRVGLFEPCWEHSLQGLRVANLGGLAQTQSEQFGFQTVLRVDYFVLIYWSIWQYRKQPDKLNNSAAGHIGQFLLWRIRLGRLE